MSPARLSAEELIDVGLDHLGRFAFFTRDNPYVSSRAALTLPDRDRAAIAGLLNGAIDLPEWIHSRDAKRLLRGIQVGCVPRNVQLVTSEGHPRVGVGDVHAFLNAPLFWWLVSILWCQTVGRSLDPLMDEAVKGYRLHHGFLEDPRGSGVMFRDYGSAHRAWRGFATEVAREFPGEVLATNTIDLKDFYYSVVCPPSEIIAAFLRSKESPASRGRSARVLNGLLNAMHQEYAVRCAEVRPRAAAGARTIPLPVGLPSSRVLANLVVSLAIDDMQDKPAIDGVAAYADDLLLMTRELPLMAERPEDYLSRLGLVPEDGPPELQAERAQRVANLIVSLEKCATSYSRSSSDDGGGDDDGDSPGLEEAGIDPYVEGAPDPDWGGRLRTVLTAPHRRERVPRELAKEITRLVDEIRIGLDADTASSRLEALVEEMDSGLFLELRPYWTDLLVIGIAATGLDFVPQISAHFLGLVEDLEPPVESTDAMVKAIRDGLWASWFQSLSQALSVALAESELIELALLVPALFEGSVLKEMKMAKVIAFARTIRAGRLIPGTFVSAPLAEFTGWKGRLIGPDAFRDFIAWAGEQPIEGRRGELFENMARSVRFVRLHELCLALHLWVHDQPSEADWLEDAFGLMGRQPLVQMDLVEEMAAAGAGIVSPASRDQAVADDPMPAFRFALPSIPIDERQLCAAIDGDPALLGEIASAARRRVRSVVGLSARRKADVLVLPEWSVLPQQLDWVMSRAAKARMLAIAGQAPAIEKGVYSNRIWTGIPIEDAAGHRECLVPPPREKRYLSPHESGPLAEAEIRHLPPTTPTPSYEWRGIQFASLICFEFADIATRTDLKARADLLTVSSLNKDWRYFDAIQESTTRDNYCLTVCVNSGSLPGTRIMRPTRSEMSVAASVHGSDDPALLSRLIDMHPIVAARVRQLKPAEATDREPVDDLELDDYRAFSPT